MYVGWPMLTISASSELPEDCRGRWESFVEETLRETNRRNTVELVRALFCISVHIPTFCHFKMRAHKTVLCLPQVNTHNMHSSSEDDDMESPFPNDLSLQQVKNMQATAQHIAQLKMANMFRSVWFQRWGVQWARWKHQVSQGGSLQSEACRSPLYTFFYILRFFPQCDIWQNCWNKLQSRRWW